MMCGKFLLAGYGTAFLLSLVLATKGAEPWTIALMFTFGGAIMTLCVAWLWWRTHHTASGSRRDRSGASVSTSALSPAPNGLS
jgi:hypothetical protein